jgi:hypothetical protein
MAIQHRDKERSIQVLLARFLSFTRFARRHRLTWALSSLFFRRSHRLLLAERGPSQQSQVGIKSGRPRPFKSGLLQIIEELGPLNSQSFLKR